MAKDFRENSVSGFREIGNSRTSCNVCERGVVWQNLIVDSTTDSEFIPTLRFQAHAQFDRRRASGKEVHQKTRDAVRQTGFILLKTGDGM
jgi:hypothetical protein